MQQNQTNSTTSNQKKLLSSYEIQKAITHSKFFTKIKISISARLVLRALIDFYNPEKNNCYPSQSTLSKVCDISKASTERAIKELKSVGILITSCKLGFSNNYAFTNNFFQMIADISPKRYHPQIEGSTPLNLRDNPPQFEGQTNKEQIKKTSNFSKKNYFLPEGILYKTPEQTKKELEEKRGISGKPSEQTKKALEKMGIKCNIT